MKWVVFVVRVYKDLKILFYGSEIRFKDLMRMIWFIIVFDIFISEISSKFF